jgi:branched-chain amino acid aminotransferase
MTTEYININGSIVDVNFAKLNIDNRAFQYGDGFFESMRTQNGQLLYEANHQRRLEESLDFFEMENNTINLKKEVQKTLEANQLLDARCKIICYRADGGMYLPSNAKYNYVITAKHSDDKGFKALESGLNARIYHTNTKPCCPLSNYKSTAAQLYVLASLFGKKSNADEVVLINQHGRICEGANANIYFAKPNNIVHRIHLSEGCLNGVMAQVADKAMQDAGWHVIETPIAIDQLNDYTEAWLSNVSRGIRRIASIDGVTFSERSTSDRLIDLLNNQSF